MTTLSDLTLAQLTTAYGVLAGIPVKAKTFNGKQKAQSRLEALLAERNLTVTDALHAAGISTATPAHEANSAPTVAAEPTSPTTAPEPPEPSVSAPVAPTEASGAAPADPTAVPLVLADPTKRNLALEAVLDALIAAGQEPASALAATEWLETLMTKALTPPERRPRQHRDTEPKAPRTGTKQEIVIELLRRPEGATIDQMMEATGWLSHTCRGFLAGAVKKRLGLNLTTERVRMVGGNRQGAPGSYTVYRVA